MVIPKGSGMPGLRVFAVQGPGIYIGGACKRGSGGRKLYAGTRGWMKSAEDRQIWTER
jgi:hypothetical protein